MTKDRLATGLIFAAVLAIGLALGSRFTQGPTPAYAQFGSGSGVFIEELEDASEKADDFHYFGETYALIQPDGTTKLLRITWKRAVVDDEKWGDAFDQSKNTFKVEMIPTN